MKLERDSKFKLQTINLEGGSGTVLDEHIKKELLNMRIQHESLFEKAQLNSDKIVALEVEITNIQRSDRSPDGRKALNNSPFSEDLKEQ